MEQPSLAHDIDHADLVVVGDVVDVSSWSPSRRGQVVTVSVVETISGATPALVELILPVGHGPSGTWLGIAGIPLPTAGSRMVLVLSYNHVNRGYNLVGLDSTMTRVRDATRSRYVAMSQAGQFVGKVECDGVVPVDSQISAADPVARATSRSLDDDTALVKGLEWDDAILQLKACF